MRARSTRSRSTRPSTSDSASGDASPNSHGLFRNQLFNDDASRNRAELEPIDYLTRSTTPHAGHASIALAVVVITVAVWLTWGSIDQSLWLTGKILDAPAADRGSDESRDNVIRIETEVRLFDAARLLAGREVDLFQSAHAGTFLSGTIRRVHRNGALRSPRRNATLHLDVEYDRASLFDPSSQGREQNYRLRVSIGSQRPIDLLLGLTRPRLAREP